MHISFQVSVTITNEKSVSTVLSSVARNLLKTDVTWGKIASLYCVAGGLAIDCVQTGHPEYLYGIIETMGLVIERDAATWIAQQGGWVRFYVFTFLRFYVFTFLRFYVFPAFYSKKRPILYIYRPGQPNWEYTMWKF